MRRVRRGDQGAALPLAAITLALLVSLLLGLSLVSSTEPTIASNQLRTAQAHALAEAGIERALWALRRPEAPEGLPDPLPAIVPPPFDGSRLVALAVEGVSMGGFRVTVRPGAAPNEREVVSVGWAPTDDIFDTRPRAHQRLSVILWRLPEPARNAPCALCALGDMALADRAIVDARADLRCGAKLGAWSTGGVSIAAAAQLLGADGNDTANEAGDYRQGQPPGAALAWMLSDRDILALKRLARARGTYYSGAVVFDRPPPDGLVFVDTVTGAALTSTTPLGEMARVELRGGAFRGWLVVAGSLDISGDASVRGLAYAQDGFAYRGEAPGGVEGQVVAAGIRGGSASLSRAGGSPAVAFDCAATLDGDGAVPGGWMLKAGSYREVPDP